MADENVSGLKIGVVTNDGVVELSGEVNSHEAFYSAVATAHSADGVEDVDASHLKITAQSEHPIEDSLITAKVKGMFLREKLFGDKPINMSGVKVQTTNGIVTLSGKTDSKAQGKDAEKIAKQVKGVKEVKNELS